MELKEQNNIVRQCQEGNKQAFRQLVGEYQRMVFSLCLKMLADEKEAEDAYQDTFVHVWLGIRKFDIEKGKLSTWIYTIASRICLDKLKGRKLLMPMPADESAFRQYAADPSPERKLMNSEWVAIVKVLAAKLSPKQQLVFTLRMLENVPMEEVIEITGLTAEKVKSNLYVARKQIQQQLKQLGYDEE